MNVIETAIPGVLVIEPKLFGDARGFFLEIYHEDRYDGSGIGSRFVQDNLSRSAQGCPARPACAKSAVAGEACNGPARLRA